MNNAAKSSFNEYKGCLDQKDMKDKIKSIIKYYTNEYKFFGYRLINSTLRSLNEKFMNWMSMFIIPLKNSLFLYDDSHINQLVKT